MKTKKCSMCSKSFLTYRKKQKFCSKLCFSISTQGRKGTTTGKKMSSETKKKISQANSKPRVEYKCIGCGKIFYDLLSKKRICCSVKCFHTYVNPILIKNRFLTNDTRNKMRIAAINRKSKQKNKNTDIELIMRSILDSMSIEYIEQHRLCDITISDFYIPTYNIAIFCDGDYWHQSDYDVANDTSKSLVLMANGYKVVRILGSLIKQNIEECKQIIQKSINSKIILSAGELIDKYTILLIKEFHITPHTQKHKILLNQISHIEIAILDYFFNNFKFNKENIKHFLNRVKELTYTNAELYEAEDLFREYNNSISSLSYANLIRILNDRRNAIKNSINHIFYNQMIEVKQYSKDFN